MICMYKIGVIGDYDSICGFAALGADTFVCNDPEQARHTVRTLARADYGVLYITEPCFFAAKAQIDEVGEALTPAFIPIPSVQQSDGAGRAQMKKYVEQAVGSDIIYNDE